MDEAPNFCEVAMGAAVLQGALEARALGFGFGVMYSTRQRCYSTVLGCIPAEAVFKCFRENDSSSLQAWLMYLALEQSVN